MFLCERIFFPLPLVNGIYKPIYLYSIYNTPQYVFQKTLQSLIIVFTFCIYLCTLYSLNFSFAVFILKEEKSLKFVWWWLVVKQFFSECYTQQGISKETHYDTFYIMLYIIYYVMDLLPFEQFLIIIFFQTGDNCLVQLASRYTQELQRLVGSLAYTTPSTLINCAEVLQQLEDLRLAEWSDHAPPPPSAPLPGRYNEFDNQFWMY